MGGDATLNAINLNEEMAVESHRVNEFDAINPTHKTDCSFAKQLVIPGTMQRSKKFISYDSLRYEKERLETFIDWPVNWLKPEDLARNGFYYLRTADHTACVFCRGIVGVWEDGDTPRGEHQRHFPHCSFIRGDAVGNIPIEQGQILSKLTPTASQSVDVCGTSTRLMSGSYPENGKS